MIKKEAVLNLQTYKMFEGDTELYVSLDDVIDLVEKDDQKTGNWILKIEDWNRWTCSECGFSERPDIHVSLGYDFCPKCGIKIAGVISEKE